MLLISKVTVVFGNKMRIKYVWFLDRQNLAVGSVQTPCPDPYNFHSVTVTQAVIYSPKIKSVI